MTPTLADLRPLALDLALIIGAFCVLSLDLFLPHGRKRVLGALTFLILAGVFTASFFVDVSGPAFSNAYLGSAWALAWKRIALFSGALATLGALDHVDRHFRNRQGEFYLLLLFCLAGMTILPGTRDLITLLVCFELMGIPLSVLAAYAKTDDKTGVHKHATEAGLKLYIVSAVSTAITVFGLSFVYGMTGATQLDAIAHAPLSPLLSLGMLLTLAGLSFKVGAVPFHMWIPDTYQGAPTPFVAFLSVAPKATGFAALAALLLGAFRANLNALCAVLTFFLVASIVLGNLLALPQTDSKRMLGYSGIAQVGYMLIGLVTANAYGMSMLLFYVVGYVVSNMGVFFVLEAIASDRATDREGAAISDLDGLVRRSPWLGLSLLMFLLSLAGIPFAVGFWAKLFIFMAAYKTGHTALVLLGATLAIVALFYYLGLARAAFMAPPKDASPVRVPLPLSAAIVVCLIAVVGLGLYPAPFLASASQAASAFFALR